jgi:acetylornithine/succinyldiaminopimelate/putrescine aminotransferase
MDSRSPALAPDRADAPDAVADGELTTLLAELRTEVGPRDTVGLSDAALAPFATDRQLLQAVREALEVRRALAPAERAALSGPEAELVRSLQDGVLNFYPDDAVNPYVPLAARGPWVVSSHGAVLHDSGGYGMLGFGHGPQPVIDAMARPVVMANVMTASFSQSRFIAALRAELGHTRGGCPFSQFVCLNSGSESVTLAARIADINALRMTRPGGPHEGKRPVFIAQEGAFHGRTDRPAQVSHSTRKAYTAHLASFQQRDNLFVVPPNDVAALRASFERATAENRFVECVFIEPVMGEGRPGHALERAFYDEARALATAHDSMLLIDSIQAGLRATGCLSIVDYPGFEDAEAPDLETWSKALNGGQYPLSVVGLSGRAAATYARGVYGNTMTTNPRALDVACEVLARVTPELRQNVRQRGREFLDGLRAIQNELPDVILDVSGTGLLFCAELDPERFPVMGEGGVERLARHRGIGVIHGGKNALRFTPHFAITAAERDLLLGELGALLRELHAARS